MVELLKGIKAAWLKILRKKESQLQNSLDLILKSSAMKSVIYTVWALGKGHLLIHPYEGNYRKKNGTG
jgi:hypothetical protein